MELSTKELTQLLMAIDLRQKRIEKRKADDDPELDLSPAYWNECLKTLEDARAKIRVELAAKDTQEFLRIAKFLHRPPKKPKVGLGVGERRLRI